MHGANLKTVPARFWRGQPAFPRISSGILLSLFFFFSSPKETAQVSVSATDTVSGEF